MNFATGTVTFHDDAGKHDDRNGRECGGRTFAVKSFGVGGMYSIVVVCWCCERELLAFENGLAPEPASSLSL